MSDTVYKIITDQILAQLQKGVAPWRRPWRMGEDGPRSIHGRFYRGINVFLLMAAGFDSPYWITWKEAERRGGKIKADQTKRGTIVVFWKMLKVEGKPGEKDKTVPILRYYRVWNLEQTEGIEAPKRRESTATEPTADERHDAAQAIVDGFENAPKITKRGNRAFYVPSTDSVTVPPTKQYNDLDEYFSTLFHELGHSTMHPTRCNRKASAGNAFGSHAYGREELIAEMAASFLCAESGILTTQENSAAYLDNWVKAIKEDVRAVVVAAGAAQKAADHILGRELKEEEAA